MTKNEYAFIIGVICGIAFSTCTNAAPLEEVYNKLSRSVVRITNEAENSGGTGFVTRTPKGKIVTVTNWHVCGDAKYMWAFRHAEFTQVKIKVLATDSQHDLCALEATPGLALAPGAPMKDLRFIALYVVGHPLLRHATPTTGNATGPIRARIRLESKKDEKCPKDFAFATDGTDFFCLKEYDVQDTTIPVFPGNSGSPVVNSNLELLGVINGVDGGTGWGTMIDIKDVQEFLGRL